MLFDTILIVNYMQLQCILQYVKHARTIITTHSKRDDHIHCLHFRKRISNCFYCFSFLSLFLLIEMEQKIESGLEFILKYQLQTSKRVSRGRKRNLVVNLLSIWYRIIFGPILPNKNSKSDFMRTTFYSVPTKLTHHNSINHNCTHTHTRIYC